LDISNVQLSLSRDGNVENLSLDGIDISGTISSWRSQTTSPGSSTSNSWEFDGMPILGIIFFEPIPLQITPVPGKVDTFALSYSKSQSQDNAVVGHRSESYEFSGTLRRLKKSETP
jgi:hypothetical protein